MTSRRIYVSPYHSPLNLLTGLTTNALNLLSYQPPQPPQPTKYIYIYIHTYIHIYTIYIYIPCIYVYTCIFIFIHTHTQAVASVALVDVESVIIKTTRAARAANHRPSNTIPPDHQASLRTEALAVQTSVYADAGGDVTLVGSRLSEAALQSALTARGMSGAFSRSPTIGDAPVACGQPTHTCTPSPATDYSALAPAGPANSTGPRPEPENTELGTCICDLTWKQCDANCQCDAAEEGGDCSKGELEVFTDEYGYEFQRERAPVEVPLCFSQVCVCVFVCVCVACRGPALLFAGVSVCVCACVCVCVLCVCVHTHNIARL
jgi:hypothetical protein